MNLTEMPGWACRLGCGHVAALQGKPSPGDWITCTELRCQRQRHVVAVWVCGVPGPGQQGVQGELWEGAALCP